jgi:hypothetical protein
MTFAMATADAFTAVAPHRVIGVTELDGLIVPAGLEDAAAPYRELNVEVIEAT